MDSLPATALKVLGHHLESCDSYSCRLSCHALSSVVSASRDDVSHIRVVANSFQQQIQQEMRQQQQQQEEQGKNVQQAHLNKGPLPGEGVDTRGPTLEAVGDTRGPRTLSPSFTPTRSRTAASLARAAAAFGHKQARVYVDVLQQYEEETWQQMFGALLSSHSLSTLVIIEYSSSSSVGQDIKRSLELRRMQADMAGLTLQPPPAAAAAPAAAEEHNARHLPGHWLPSLAAAYTTAAAAASNSSPALQHLDLELPAPLPVALQPLLLQLTGLKTLKLSPTRVWPQSPTGCTYLDPSEPLLLPGVVAGLSALRGLESLTCYLSASQTSGIDAQVATKLQQLFSHQVMSHLTHLSLGTSPRSSQLLLSAPLVSLHSLKSLTCQPGFYVDVDNARECMQQQANAATTAAAGSSAAVSGNATYQIAPSLTKLVLKEGYSDDHEQLLQLLVGKGVPSAAAAAARTRLVHLELNSQVTAEVSTDLLSELSGLRYLKIFLGEAVKSAAATPLATQLLGLTILCQYQRLAEDFGAPFQPMPTVTGFANLTSLVIKGPRAVSISLHRDLQQLRALTHLQRFEFHGQLQDSDSPVRQFCEIPAGIHTFVLTITPDYDYELDPTVRISLRSFPASLTSVKFEGCNLALDDDKGDEGITNPFGLHNLKEFTAQMTNLDDAHRLLRHCSGLHKLSLQGSIPHTPINSSSSSSSCTASSSGFDCDDRIPLQLPLLCPQLTSLHLKLCRQTTGGPGSSSDSNSSSSRPPPADVVSSCLLPEIAQLRGLRALSLEISSWLPLHHTLLHNLSSLSALSRLQNLTLHAWIHLDQPPQQQPQQQQEQQRQQYGLQTADINLTPIAAAAAGEEASQKPTTDPALLLTRGDLKEDLLYASDGPEFPTWWNTAVTDTRNFLYNTLAGSCPGLRYLNLHIYLEHDVDDIEAGTNLPMTSSYCQKVLSSRQDLIEIENSFMNCLVLQGPQNV